MSEPFDFREMLRRAIEARRQPPPRRQAVRLLWSVVGQMLCLGSTSAWQLCRELGFDPDERVKG